MWIRLKNLLVLKKLLGFDSSNFFYICFTKNYPDEPTELKVKKTVNGGFVNGGLNGSVEANPN